MLISVSRAFTPGNQPSVQPAGQPVTNKLSITDHFRQKGARRHRPDGKDKQSHVGITCFAGAGCRSWSYFQLAYPFERTGHRRLACKPKPLNLTYSLVKELAIGCALGLWPRAFNFRHSRRTRVSVSPVRFPSGRLTRIRPFDCAHGRRYVSRGSVASFLPAVPSHRRSRRRPWLFGRFALRAAAVR